MVTITRKMTGKLVNPGIRLSEIEALLPMFPAGVYGIENADGAEIAEAKVSRGKCRLYVQGRPATVLHDVTGERLITDVPAACAETTDYVENPIQAARHASAVLAADKGIPSHIESHNGRDYAVVTDEGKRFLFCQK